MEVLEGDQILASVRWEEVEPDGALGPAALAALASFEAETDPWPAAVCMLAAASHLQESQMVPVGERWQAWRLR